MICTNVFPKVRAKIMNKRRILLIKENKLAMFDKSSSKE